MRLGSSSTVREGVRTQKAPSLTVYWPVSASQLQKSNLIASCNCLGEMIDRGKPKVEAPLVLVSVNVFVAAFAENAEYLLMLTNEK